MNATLLNANALNRHQSPLDEALDLPDFSQAGDPASTTLTATPSFAAFQRPMSTANVVPMSSAAYDVSQVAATSVSGDMPSVITSSGSAFVITATIRACAPACFATPVA